MHQREENTARGLMRDSLDITSCRMGSRICRVLQVRLRYLATGYPWATHACILSQLGKQNASLNVYSTMASWHQRTGVAPVRRTSAEVPMIIGAPCYRRSPWAAPPARSRTPM